DRRSESPDRVEVPLDDLCRLVADEFRPMAEANGLHLTTGALTEGVTVMGDPERLRVLLENLVDNAVNYTAAHGVIEASVAISAARAEIAVADTGPEIPPEHLPHLFDRFYRVDKSRSRALGGSGLGLSICRAIAEQHGGEIAAESLPGRGTRF